MSQNNHSDHAHVAGQPRELAADYLKPAALEYWQAWLANEARLAHNPFVDLRPRSGLAGRISGGGYPGIRGRPGFRRRAGLVLLEDRPVPAGRADGRAFSSRAKTWLRRRTPRRPSRFSALYPAAGIRPGFSARGESPPRRIGKPPIGQPACGRPASAKEAEPWQKNHLVIRPVL